MTSMVGVDEAMGADSSDPTGELKMTYEVYTWKLSADTDPVLVERKKFTKYFDAWDYIELMEEKGYECHLSDNESLKNLKQ